MPHFIQKKCPSCGGRLELISGNTYECQSCGNISELNEHNINLYHDLLDVAAARESLNFKYAEQKCYKLLEAYKNDNLAEVYWNLLLCEQRVMFETNQQGELFPSFYDVVSIEIESSKNYKLMLEHLNKFSPQNKAKYEELVEKMYNAKRKYRKIKDTSEPCDIFICFKKSKFEEEGGGDTVDCRIAYNLYKKFFKDYNVFFSEESLNNIAVREFEPNIYHALYTAKVMLIVCSKRGYIESQWVKNEWNRFKMMSDNTAQTKAIIPIFIEGFTPELLPYELRSFQGYSNDMFLIDNLESAVKEIINPTDKQAEFEASIAAKMQGQFETQMQTHMEALKSRLSVQQNKKTGGSVVVDIAEIKRLADSLFASGKYFDARSKYWDYLDYKPDDIFVTYLCALCDAKAYCGAYDDDKGTLELFAATQKYIQSSLNDSKSISQHGSIAKVISNLEEVLCEHLSNIYNESKKDINTEWKASTLESGQIDLNYAKKNYNEYINRIKPYITALESFLDNIVVNLKNSADGKSYFNNIPKMINRILEFYKKTFESKGEYSEDIIVYVNSVREHRKQIKHLSQKYELTDKQKEYCDSIVKKAREYSFYLEAVSFMAQKKYYEAYEILKQINILDSKKLFNVCDNQSGEVRWTRAVTLYESKKYKEAKDLFTGLVKNYSDSQKYIKLIDESLMAEDYALATKLYSQCNFSEAIKYFRKLAVQSATNEYAIPVNGYKDSNSKFNACSEALERLRIKRNRPATIAIDVILAIISLIMLIVSFLPSKIYPVMHWAIFLVFAIVILCGFSFIIHKKKSNNSINKPVLSICLLICSVLCTLWVIIMPQITGIKISDANGFNAMKNYKTCNYTLTQDVDFNNTKIPSTSSFNKNFYGNGHTISNVILEYNWIENNKGNIENLKFKNIAIGHSESCFIKNNSGSINDIEIDSVQYYSNKYNMTATGLICTNNNSSGIIENVVISNATIKTKFEIYSPDVYYGILSTENKGVIRNCRILDTNLVVTTHYNSWLYAGSLYVGKFVGMNYGTISNCYTENLEVEASGGYSGNLAGKSN